MTIPTILRRTALATAALVATVGLSVPNVVSAQPAAAPAAQSQTQQPRNIVFILLDDLRFDHMGFLQSNGLKTPNIDFLAKNGVYFPNAVVTSSLCSPSRATILTGQSTRNHGIVDNNSSSEKGLVFFPSYLQQAGYQTSFFGKWHMGDETDMPRPGFDKWVSFKGQGNYLPTDGLSAEALAAGKRQMLNVDGKATAQQGYMTDELTDYALNWLQKERDPKKPFFLYLSHKAVHSDVTPAERHKDLYKDMQIKLPDTLADTPENNAGKPVWVQNQRNSWHGADFAYHDKTDLVEMQRGIFRTLASVDDSVGRVLEYLRANKLENNTMVVFYSDNGFMFGDHGLIDKRNAYEPSVRVPLVVYAPGELPAGVTNTAMVRNLDMAPTFLDVARLPKPAQMEGASFLPVAEGKVKEKDWNPGDFVYEYYWEWSFPMTPTTFAIERDRMKYIQYHGVWDIEELYDLAKDPDEKRNLIDEPALLATKIALRKALYQQLANSGGKHVVPYTARNSTGIVLRDVDGKRAADFPATWYTKPGLPTKFNGFYSDNEAKLKATQEGRRYVPQR